MTRLALTLAQGNPAGGGATSEVILATAGGLDSGRDPGPLANPSQYLILFGLFGIFPAGFLSSCGARRTC